MRVRAARGRAEVFRSAMDAIRRGLRRTAEAFGAGFRSILHGRTLSEELIDQVERTLVSADVGVRAARELCVGLRADFRAGRVPRGATVLASGSQGAGTTARCVAVAS